MEKTHWPRIAAMMLFILLSILTLPYGSILLYRTYQVDNFDGRTVLLGMVKDMEGKPLGSVDVDCEGVHTVTSDKGFFELKEVPEGHVRVFFYRPGYVRLSIDWIAYPLSELKGANPSDTVNNISTQYDITLSREISYRPLNGGYVNGTLELMIGPILDMDMDQTVLIISNGTDPGMIRNLSSERSIIRIEGNGTFHIGVKGKNGSIYGFHPVGSSIDITASVADLIRNGSRIAWKGGMGTIILDKAMVSMQGAMYTLMDEVHHNLVANGYFSKEPLSFRLEPGIYRIELTGPHVIDRGITNIVLEEGSVIEVNMTLESAETMQRFYGMDIRGNYILAILDLGAGILFILGAWGIQRRSHWAVPMSLAFLGFISVGFSVKGMGIVQVLSVALVVILFILFSRENRARSG